MKLVHTINKNKDDIDDYIDDLLNSYYDKLKTWKEDIKIDGKNIEKANIGQSSLMAYYDEIKVKVKALSELYEFRVKEARSNALKNIINHSKQDHSERTRERLIDTDVVYMKRMKILLEIRELQSLLESITEQIKNRAFALNNIVKIRIAELEDITLYE